MQRRDNFFIAKAVQAYPVRFGNLPFGKGRNITVLKDLKLFRIALEL